jgi:hypothetical protein
MPLQKLPPQGQSTADSQLTKRRQLQERRRTLQTISELSATEVPPPAFRTSLGPTPLRQRVGALPHIPNTSIARKRQSLPQYCAGPESSQTHSSLTVASVHMMAPQRMPSRSRLDAGTSPQPEGGWNARRDRARMQAEQALSGTTTRPRPSHPNLQDGKVPLKHIATPTLHNKSSQPYLRSHYIQQQLLRNRRSMTSTPSRSDQRSTSGRSSRQTSPRDDVDSSERTSTDASSLHSSLDSTMRMPRSSCSSQSFTLQGVPPLPTGCAQATRSYYTAATSHPYNGYPVQLPGPMYSPAPSDMRTMSLPYMRNYPPPLVNQIPSMPPGIPNTPINNQYNSAHKARSKSLSAQSTPSHHRQGHAKHTSQPSIPYQTQMNPSHRPTLPPSRPKSTSSASSRHRSTSLKSSVPTHVRSQSSSAAHPEREKRKTEREETKAEFDGVQRAKIRERVRRANEMEQEKERELQALGKGAEKVKVKEQIGVEKEGGCFGGMFGRMGIGIGKGRGKA